MARRITFSPSLLTWERHSMGDSGALSPHPPVKVKSVVAGAGNVATVKSSMCQVRIEPTASAMLRHTHTTVLPLPTRLQTLVAGRVVEQY